MCGAETMSRRPKRLEESPESLPFARRADRKWTENTKRLGVGGGGVAGWCCVGGGGAGKELSEAGSEVRHIKVAVCISVQ